MFLPSRPSTRFLIAAAMASLLTPSQGRAQEWTESSIIQKFLEQSPHAREARARVAVAEAEARGRTLYTNPSVNYTRESAGFTEFFQAEQTLPVNGRLKLLKQVGASSVRAAEADGAFSLWQAKTSLRKAFYRVLATQRRESLYANAIKEVESVIKILRDREKEGEGTKYDRLRAERERTELMAEMALIRAELALDRSQLLAFLPPDTSIPTVAGQIESTLAAPNPSELVQRAIAAREDYRAELKRAEQYRLEQRAAERLRYPDPVLSAGLKRADLGQRTTGPRDIANGPVIGLTVPIPFFNKGQTEVARFAAEQERVGARLQILAQQIRSAVEGSVQAFQIRASARDEYARELAASGPELIRIATIAYQEGEIGILQLLDAYRTQRLAQLRMLDIHSAVKDAQIELEKAIGEEFAK
jgi:outer membrane protein, heavy metal efflux system